MDIKAIELKITNLSKKIENAELYIKEIEKHKKSIFEFWKFTNKDELPSLQEGDIEEESHKEKIEKLLKETLKQDRAKTQVEGFTKLNLMELTRKHICAHNS